MNRQNPTPWWVWLLPLPLVWWASARLALRWDAAAGLAEMLAAVNDLLARPFPVYYTPQTPRFLLLGTALYAVVAIVITISAYTVNKTANRFLMGQTAVLPSLIGAFTVGFLGNIYSRLFHSSAFTATVSGVMILVPVGVIFVAESIRRLPRPCAKSGLGDMNAALTFADSLKLTAEMLKTVIGILLGLSAGHCAVHFGRNDRASMFSF